MKLLIICGIAIFAAMAKAEDYSLILPEFPRPATIAFPEGFLPPTTKEEKERHSRLLEYFRLNPERKGNYEHVFLKDWQNPNPMPQIVIGTLGATKGNQGKISKKNWEEIREYFIQASEAEIEKVRREITPRVMQSSPINEELQKDLVWIEDQNDPNSATTLSYIRVMRDEDNPEQFSARKIMYHNGYMIFANVVVDANQAAALSNIRKYLNDLKLVSVE